LKICGSIPASLKETGDVAFEQSRMKAQLQLDAFKQDAHSRKTAAHHLQELYEIKAGETIAEISLPELAARWEFLPIKRKWKPAQVKVQKANIEQFRSFMSEKYPQVKELSQVTRKMALAWLKNLSEKRCPAKAAIPARSTTVG